MKPYDVALEATGGLECARWAPNVAATRFTLGSVNIEG
jgi:hypothetical protein